MKTQNYSELEREKLLEMYEEGGNDTIPQIAETLGKSINSVRAKLVREKVYIAPDKSIRVKKNGLSKKEILIELENLGIVPDGLEGATKQALLNIKERLENV